MSKNALKLGNCGHTTEKRTKVIVIKYTCLDNIVTVKSSLKTSEPQNKFETHTDIVSRNNRILMSTICMPRNINVKYFIAYLSTETVQDLHF